MRKHTSSDFKWRHYQGEAILLCVRWYLRYRVSYRDLEEMMKERGLNADHTTIYRWVQHYAPEIQKRASYFLGSVANNDRVQRGPSNRLTYISRIGSLSPNCLLMNFLIDSELLSIKW